MVLDDLTTSGPVGKRMRCDGHDDQGVHVGLNDGSAARQRVSSRSGRGRHDQAVAAVGVDVVPVNGGPEILHMARIDGLQDHVVQGEEGARSAFPPNILASSIRRLSVT